MEHFCGSTISVTYRRRSRDLPVESYKELLAIRLPRPGEDRGWLIVVPVGFAMEWSTTDLPNQSRTICIGSKSLCKTTECRFWQITATTVALNFAGPIQQDFEA